MALSSGLTFTPNLWANSTGTQPTGQITQSAYEAYKPIISDLIDYSAPKNKYLKYGTYSGDAEAIKSRLGEYAVYDPSQYGTLADYLKPKAATLVDGQMLFKPKEFETLTGGLTALEAEKLKAVTPMLGGLKSVGQIGTQSYYTKPELEAQLGKYATSDISKLTGLPEFKGLQSVANVDNTPYYLKSDLEKAQTALGNYATADISPYTALSEFKNLKPITTIDKTPYYLKSDLEKAQKDAAANYKAIDYNKLDASTWAGAQAKQKAIKVGNNYVLTTADATYIQDPASGVTWTIPAGYSYAGQGGRGYTSDTYYKNAAGDVIEKNTYDYVNNPQDYWGTKLPTGYWVNPLDLADIGYRPQSPGSTSYDAGPYFTPTSLWQPIKSGDSKNGSAYYWNNLPTADAIKANAVSATIGGQAGLLFPSYQNYLNALSSSAAPHQVNVTETRWNSGGGVGGWFGGILGELGKGISGALQGIGPWGQLALSFVPYVGPVVAGLAAGSNIGTGLASGNLGQAALGAIQAAGIAAPNLNLPGAIGNTITSGAGGQALSNAVGGAVLSSGLGILNGQNLEQTLKNAAIGGLTSYAGSLAGEGLGNLFKDVGSKMDGTKMTPLQLIGANLGSGLAQGGLSSLLRGQNLGQGLTMGGLAGLSGGLGLTAGTLASNALKSSLGSSNYLTQALPKIGGSATNLAVKQSLLNQLYNKRS